MLALADRLAPLATRGRRWRTRFAPAPTGWLHLGHAVNAVWVWSLAQAFDGDVVLRIEDHDALRCRPEYDQGVLEDLAWLGLWDGTPPIRQSARGDAYAAALERLANRSLAYPCRCSRRDIAAVSPAGPDGEHRYPGTCRDAGVPPQETAARRVRMADGVEHFDDLRLGPQTQSPAQQCGDVLVRDRHGAWTYQFAVVVDDLAQGIDLIVRGEDLLPSTGRQRRLAALLEGTPPSVVHHPLVRHPTGEKLSKSNRDTGLRELRAAGITRDAVLGLAARLGGLADTDAPLAPDALWRLWR